jgi:competence protein ComEA
VPDTFDWKLAGWIVAGLVVVVLGVQSLAGRGRSDPAEAVQIEPARDGPARGAGTAPGLYVHVAGEVRRPGLYEVPGGARAAAALERAGGPTRRADMAAVNLAAKVTDGQQIVVPRAGGPAAMPPGAAAGTTDGAPPVAGVAPVSLATATAEQLDAVDGIGPTLAQRIVAERTRRGGFRSVDDLRNVDGIGEKRLARLKSALRP